jgi:hypothetical protein
MVTFPDALDRPIDVFGHGTPHQPKDRIGVRGARSVSSSASLPDAIRVISRRSSGGSIDRLAG